MALGITTTNTTPTPVTTQTVVPETTSGGVIPGVTPNSKLSLTTQVATPAITTSTGTPETTTNTTTPGVTTTADVTPTSATPGKFARGLDKLKLQNPIYKQLEKVFSDFKTVTDTFSSVTAYVRNITDPLVTNNLDIIFSANKGLEDLSITSDLFTTRMIFGRDLADQISFADLGVEYNLNTNYSDTISISEFIETAMSFIKDIAGQETTTILDLQISIGFSTTIVDTANGTDSLAKLFSAVISETTLAYIRTDADYTNSVLKFLEDYIQVATETPITPYKLFTEILTVQETSERVWDIFREFFDTVVSTDDYYGAANIDDDQYASVNKTVVDVLNFGEAVDLLPIFALYITQQDSYSAIDSAEILTNKLLDSAINSAGNELTEITTGKTLEEFNSFNEDNEFYSSLVKNESINITEEFSKALSNKALFDFTLSVDSTEFNTETLVLDTSGISDTLIPEMTFRRVFEDTGASNDSTYSLDVTKYAINTLAIQTETSIVKTNIFTDVSSTTDSFNRQVDYVRVFSDLVDITDDYYGAATVGDDEYVSFDKRVNDYLATQERFQKYFTTTKSDNITNSSTAVIELANYYYELNTISDTKDLQYFKDTSELLSITNPTVSNISKISEELLQISDPYFSVATFNRGFSEQITNTSIPSILIDIPKTDSVAQTDNFSRLVNYIRNVTENKVTSEVFVNTARLFKVEPLTLQDALERSFIRQASDSKTQSTDTFNRVVNYIRQFNNLVISTDDYYGTANIDDDQIASVRKRLVDVANIDDLDFYIVKTVYTNRFTNALITDPISLNPRKPVADVFSFTDLNYNNVLKTTLESQTLSEYQYLNTSKILTNNLTITDLCLTSGSFNRIFTELISEVELVEINSSIIKSDQVLVQDYYSSIANFYRQVNELKTLTEEQKFSNNKYVINTLGIIDIKAALVNKYPDSELFTQTDDSYTITDFVRNFEDFVDATDDYYGAATVGDDEYAQINKGLTDIVSFGEDVDLLPITFTLYTPQEEFFINIDESTLFISSYPDYELNLINNAFEERYIDISKEVNTDTLYNYNLINFYVDRVQDDDTITTTSEDIVFTSNTYIDFQEYVYNDNNEFSLDVRPVIEDTVTFSQNYSYIMVYRRVLLEIMALNSSSDRRYIEIGKYLDNTNNIAYLNTDSITFVPNKGVQDQKFIFDFLTTQLSTSYGIYDTVTATDDYYGVSNIDDDQYAQFNKTLADSYTVVDYPVYTVSIEKADSITKAEQTTLNIGKNTTETLQPTETFTYSKFAVTLFTDQILKSDSGTINNQDYFASTYVEPGYAGTNRTIGS